MKLHQQFSNFNNRMTCLGQFGGFLFEEVSFNKNDQDIAFNRLKALALMTFSHTEPQIEIKNVI